MSLLSELTTIMGTLKIPCEVAVFSTTPAPPQFAVFIPLDDSFQCADDEPEQDVQTVRISVYSTTNYLTLAKTIAKAIIAAGLTITDRRFIEHEDDTGYYHYAIDVQANYLWEE